MQKKLVLKRVMALGVILLVLTLVMGSRLADLQLIHGAEYYERSEQKLRRNSVIKASRGEILDRLGRPIVTNDMGFRILFDYAYWDKENQNKVILNLIELMNKNGGTYYDTLPVTKTEPYGYTFEADSTEQKKLQKFLSERKKLPQAPDAPALIQALYERYAIDSSLSEDKRRLIAGVRYEMEQRGFSVYTDFTFATNVSIETVSRIKERSADFKGADIDVEPIRKYRTDLAAHLIGCVGPIYAEEYAELKEKGYKKNAIIGKDGMEKALEDWLKGTDGARSVETNIAGKVTDEVVSVEPVPGKNCVLTIDLNLQEAAEKSLSETIANIRQKGKTLADRQGADIKGGAVVVIDVRNGEILAMASNPSYKIATFNQDFASLKADPLKPMVNRAISSAFPPGSTFKMVTAVAGLSEGVVNPSTVIVDKGVYSYYAPNYTPACWVYNEYHRTHGAQTVSDAIKNSCNYYFFEVSRLLTIDRLNIYAKKLGLGQKTGIELGGEVAGNLAGPESREAKGGEKWQPGETIQAGIGQSEQLFTPIQLANYVATLVNGGTRYQPHLLKSVQEYRYGNTVYEYEPKVLDKIDIASVNLKAIMEGMRSVTEEGGTASSVFRNYPIAVGGKTGSAQVRKGSSAHGVFVAFAPYDKPEIAVCVIGENAGSGNSVAPVAKSIFDAYFGLTEGEQKITQENVLIG